MNRIRRGLLAALSVLPVLSIAFAAQAALSGVPAASESDDRPVGGSGPSYSR